MVEDARVEAVVAVVSDLVGAVMTTYLGEVGVLFNALDAYVINGTTVYYC